MNEMQFGVWDGGLLIDKPKGPTSHDVVDAIRKHIKVKKVGHCGALDPNATGLLVLMLGKATKLAGRFLASDKSYEGAIKLGESTSTYDVEGQIIEQKPVPTDLTVEQLNGLASEFIGDLLQVPPMVSAAKVKGIPLYKLARRGIEIERTPKLVHVYFFRFYAYKPPFAFFTMKCSKGTYVRSIVHQLGQKLGCGAHLYELRRTEAGPFKVENAIPLERVLAMKPEQLQVHIIPMLQLARLILEQK